MTAAGKHKIFDRVPEGWKVLQGAVAHPRGMRWISNGKSRFGGEYEQALVPEEVAFEWRRTHTG